MVLVAGKIQCDCLGGGRVVLDKVGRLTVIAWAVRNCIKCLKRGRENNLKRKSGLVKE